jgi:hypothetical protein
LIVLTPFIFYNKQGFAIGNGLTNPEIQYMAYTDYALGNGLINKDEYERINKLIPPCLKAAEKCGITLSFFLFLSHKSLSTKREFYQFIVQVMCYFSLLTLLIYLLGTEGGQACGTALTTCMKIFDQITNITGNTNVCCQKRKVALKV